MARRALGVALAIAASVGIAGAQTLALLHVRSFELSVDRSAVAVGEPLHLSLSVHVDEKIDSLDNVQLPSLSGFEDLGDERRCATAKSGVGSDCIETLTIDANRPGDYTIGPANVEFVDAASGRIRTLESNTVSVHVTGNAKAPVPDPTPEQEIGPNPLGDLLGFGVRSLLVFLFVAIAGYALIWGFRKRPAKTVAPQPALVEPPAAVPDWHARMHELGAFLADDPSRERAVAVRGELRAHIGAGERETIADLRKRGAAGDDTAIMTALIAVERAAFCEDAYVASAAREAVPFLMA